MARADESPGRSPLWEIVRRVHPTTLPAMVTAHRGDSQNAPENTLAAFSMALEAGADLVEFDVQQCGTGELVVIHDDRVDRTADGKGEVQRMALAELRELSAGAWFAPRFATERFPLLDEVLDLLRGRAIPLVEIKIKRRRSLDAGTRIAEALKRHGMAEQAVVICRELARVHEVRAASPNTPICTVTFTKRAARLATRVKALCGVDCYWKSVSRRLVLDLHAASFFMTPWTVNRVEDMQRLLRLGCETIISDCPLILREAIEAFDLSRASEPEALLPVEAVEAGEQREVASEREEREDEAAIPEELSAELTASDFELDAYRPEPPPP